MGVLKFHNMSCAPVIYMPCEKRMRAPNVSNNSRESNHRFGFQLRLDVFMFPLIEGRDIESPRMTPTRVNLYHFSMNLKLHPYASPVLVFFYSFFYFCETAVPVE